MTEEAKFDDATIRSYAERLRGEFEELTAQGELGAEDRATVALDQQSVGRLSRMDALQRQAMAAARSRRLDARRARIAGALARIAGALARIDEGEFVNQH